MRKPVPTQASHEIAPVALGTVPERNVSWTLAQPPMGRKPSSAPWLCGGQAAAAYHGLVESGPQGTMKSAAG